MSSYVSSYQHSIVCGGTQGGMVETSCNGRHRETIFLPRHLVMLLWIASRQKVRNWPFMKGMVKSMCCCNTRPRNIDLAILDATKKDSTNPQLLLLLWLSSWTPFPKPLGQSHWVWNKTCVVQNPNAVSIKDNLTYLVSSCLLHMCRSVACPALPRSSAVQPWSWEVWRKLGTLVRWFVKHRYLHVYISLQPCSVDGSCLRNQQTNVCVVQGFSCNGVFLWCRYAHIWF